MTRVGVVDDHPLVLAGVRARLDVVGGAVDVVVAVTSWAELLDDPAFPVDVVVLDVALGDGVPLVVKIASARAAGCAVVVLTSTQDPRTIHDAVTAGALGFLVKTCSAEVLVEAIRCAARGELFLPPEIRTRLEAYAPPRRPALSPQERRVVSLYASGLAMKSVARELGVSVETARTHLKRARDKYAELGIETHTKVALFRQASSDGWVVDDPDGGGPPEGAG